MSEPAPNAAGPPPPDPLAVALSKLDPAPHGFDRDALMFAAGQTSKLGALVFWQWVAGVAVAAALAFAGLYYFGPPRTQNAPQQPEIRSNK